MLKSGAIAVLMFETLSLWNTQEAGKVCAQGSANENTKSFLSIILYMIYFLKSLYGKNQKLVAIPNTNFTVQCWAWLIYVWDVFSVQ